jgi:hypothetical protein
MCDFQRTEGRILKTVDAVYQVDLSFWHISSTTSLVVGKNHKNLNLKNFSIEKSNRMSRTRKLVKCFASIPTSAVTRSISEIQVRKSADSVITRPVPSVKFRWEDFFFKLMFYFNNKVMSSPFERENGFSGWNTSVTFVPIVYFY